MITVQCETCKKNYETFPNWLKRRKHGFCSRKCTNIWKSTIRGENHHQYKPNTTNYNSVHDWMLKNFGKASRCENKKCSQSSKGFVWAKKHGKEYERKRGNFKQLCYKCHWQYDITKKWREKIKSGQKRRREREARLKLL